MKNKKKMVLLSLTPKTLIDNDKYLPLFYKNTETIIEPLISVIKTGKSNNYMNNIENIFYGFDWNTEDEECFLRSMSRNFIIFTKEFQSSMGPRRGNFFEELIELWLRDFKYRVLRNPKLNTGLAEILDCDLQSEWSEKWTEISKGSKIDFVLRNIDKLSLIELRTSEDTGGRTGQPSLMDKFNKFLTLVSDESFLELLEQKGVKNIDLVIATIFSQEDRKIIENPDRGRLNSLISYIIKDENIFGKLKVLFKKGAKPERSENTAEDNTQSNILSDEEFGKILGNKRSFNFQYHGITFQIRLLYGDEFFLEYFKKKLEILVTEIEEKIPDDIWLLFSIALNEIKYSKLSDSGKTLTSEIYELMICEKFHNDEIKLIFEKFDTLYSSPKNFKDFIDGMDKLTDEMRNIIFKLYEKSEEKLCPLETNDIAKTYRYIKYLSYCIFLMHLQEKEDLKQKNNSQKNKTSHEKKNSKKGKSS